MGGLGLISDPLECNVTNAEYIRRYQRSHGFIHRIILIICIGNVNIHYFRSSVVSRHSNIQLSDLKASASDRDVWRTVCEAGLNNFMND